jgi:sulfoxide reductase catalytic subunit YedY
MANLLLRPSWFIPERQVTAEHAVRNRRHFLKELGFAGTGLAACASSPAFAAASPHPAKRHPAFDPGWRLTDETKVTTYNNFYEFSTVKDRVHTLVNRFETSPWPVTITGMVGKPMTIEARELESEFGVEERVYRFRCVEAWAMIVPWTGFELRKLLEKVQPKPEAKFVKFVTATRPPDIMPGIQRLGDYPWPYTEGLRLDEAMNPLVLVATGLFGKPMPRQNGAPIRLVVPWKYGYKSIKSIVRIELTDKQPKTLWETLAPREYPFESNVNPAIPHPRWSQAMERMIDTDERVRTLPLNGYADAVGHLYPKA